MAASFLRSRPGLVRSGRWTDLAAARGGVSLLAESKECRPRQKPLQRADDNMMTREARPPTLEASSYSCSLSSDRQRMRPPNGLCGAAPPRSAPAAAHEARRLDRRRCLPTLQFVWPSPAARSAPSPPTADGPPRLPCSAQTHLIAALPQTLRSPWSIVRAAPRPRSCHRAAHCPPPRLRPRPWRQMAASLTFSDEKRMAPPFGSFRRQGPFCLGVAV